MSNAVDILMETSPAGEAAPAAGVAILIASKENRQRALDVFQHGLAALTLGATPITHIVIRADGWPTLDDMLAASFAAWIAEGKTLPPSAESFARYAALARGGFNPSRVLLEFSLEGIFRAMSWPFDSESPNATSTRAFITEWQRVAQVIWRAIAEGKDPFTETLFSEAGGFAPEVASLRADQKVYHQDLKTGTKYLLGDPHDEQKSSALLLKNPKSLLFKQWARADSESPTKDGYLILAVEWAPGDWVFSTDPVQRMSLKPLADLLDAAEMKLDANAAWFDGAAFHHTLIASPKPVSKLSDATILSIFEKWAQARRSTPGAAATPSPRNRGKVIAIAAFLLLLIGGYFAYRMVDRMKLFDPSRNATELDALNVRPLKSRGGDAQKANVALFVGVNEYRAGEFPSLSFAVDDAIAQAHLFVIELELIPPENVVLALQGEPGTWRGNKQLEHLLAKGIKPTEGSRADIVKGLDRINQISAPTGLMIVSISAHGKENADGQYVILHDAINAQLAQTAMTVADLKAMMAASKASKRLLFVDACREVPKSESKGDQPPMSRNFLEALAAAKGQGLFASCQSGQLSWENTEKGHGIFTYWLLLGLKGEAAADANGLITVGTLQKYLLDHVSSDSRRHSPAPQDPYFSLQGAEAIPLAMPVEK